MKISHFVVATVVASYFSISSPALAGQALGGQLRNVHVMNDGKALVWINVTHSSPPSGGNCTGTTIPYRFVIDTTTAAGKALLAGLLTAYALEKTVNLFGTGDCPHGYQSEGLGTFATVDP